MTTKVSKHTHQNPQVYTLQGFVCLNHDFYAFSTGMGSKEKAHSGIINEHLCYSLTTAVCIIRNGFFEATHAACGKPRQPDMSA
eukprot:m.240473 g.240473  ORF g.240473 m.240473 type:complete len:84 (-) comp15310_c1_seq1:1395-1646(-)